MKSDLQSNQRTSMICCEDLSHLYRDVKALDKINLSIEAGELFGVIGPDGAGKTTLFRIIASLISYKSGKVSVLGKDPNVDYRMIRNHIGYMPGRFSLYHDLTVEENLSFYASVFNSKVDANYHLIGDIFDQLAPFKKRRAGKLSGGMKQKLALSCALIHQPELLILDEPTTGVDAVSRVEFWDVLKRLKSSGMTILVSTPYMDEANRCDRIALMQKGSLLDVATPSEMAENFNGSLFSAKGANRFKILSSLEACEGISYAYLFGQSVHFTAEGFELETLTEKISQAHSEKLVIEMVEPTVEDCFIQMMGGSHE